MDTQKSKPAAKAVLTIGNPTSYPVKSDGTSKTLEADGKTRKTRVAFQVTGSKEAIEQYNQDMIAATGQASIDESTGNPLFTLSLEKFNKLSGNIERSVSKDGRIGWFVDNSEEKLMDSAMAGKPESEIRDYNAEKRADLKAALKVLASATSKSREAYAAIQTQAEEKL